MNRRNMINSVETTEEEEENESLIDENDSTANILHLDPSKLKTAQIHSDDDILDCRISKNQKFKRFIKTYLRIILPHFLLFCSVIFYIMLGAAYFYYLESSLEVKSKAQELTEFFVFRKNFYDKIWALKHSIHDNSKISNETFAKIHQKLFDDLILQISRLQSHGYVTKNDLLNETKNENALLWSFSNSMFFATTIIATIGYGNGKLAPSTVLGKIGCIIFALIGIPMFMITAGDMGKFMSECLVKTYKKYKTWKKNIPGKLRYVIYRIFCKKNIIDISPMKPEKESSNITWWETEYDGTDIPFVKIILIVLFYLAISAALLKAWKGWSFLDALFICFNAFATIGTANKMPSKDDNIFLLIIYIFFSVALFKMIIDLIGIIYIQKIHYFGRRFQDTDLLLYLKRKNAIQRRNASVSQNAGIELERKRLLEKRLLLEMQNKADVAPTEHVEDKIELL